MSKYKVYRPAPTSPSPYVSQNGVLLDPNIGYKKFSQAQYPSVKNIQSSFKPSKGTVVLCNNQQINIPDEFNIVSQIFGAQLNTSGLVVQDGAGTCYTASNITALSVKLSKLLDFPFLIDYCCFLRDIYDLYHQYGYPRFGKFIIKPDGSFYQPSFTGFGGIPLGVDVATTLSSSSLTTYAFNYLATGIPITLYPICDGYYKSLSYNNQIFFNLGLLAKPMNCLEKPPQCGIKISLQNFKYQYSLSSICSIKQYLLSNDGNALPIAIGGSVLNWLKYIAPELDNPEFVYPNDVQLTILPTPGHIVTIVGWTTPQPGYTKFIIKNSWSDISTFYFTIKDSDYDNSNTTIFDSPQRYIVGSQPTYDVMFVDYQDKTLNEIRSIFKNNISECCGVGTCCGDSVGVDYCEENVTKLECNKHIPYPVENPAPSELNCSNIITEYNSRQIIPFVPNININNVMNIEHADDSLTLSLDWLRQFDIVPSGDLKQDIADYIQIVDSDTPKETLLAMKNSIINRLSELFDTIENKKIVECPCCVSPTPEPLSTWNISDDDTVYAIGPVTTGGELQDFPSPFQPLYYDVTGNKIFTLYVNCSGNATVLDSWQDSISICGTNNNRWPSHNFYPVLWPELSGCAITPVIGNILGDGQEWREPNHTKAVTFTGDIDGEWTNLNNWEDASGNSPARSLPDLTSNVIIAGDVSSVPTNYTVSVDSLTINNGIKFAIEASCNDLICSGIIDRPASPVCADKYGKITYSVSANINNGTLSGELIQSFGSDAIFNNSLITNTGILNANCKLDNSSDNEGLINGDAEFDNGSRNKTGGIVNGNAIFRNGSMNTQATVEGDAQFYNDSANSFATIEGNAEFYDTSTNDSNAHINGDAIFNDNSSNQILSTIHGSATFNDLTYNIGQCASTATFNDESENGFQVSGDATFNGDSLNRLGALVSGNATFNNDSRNAGGVTGTATFNNSACNEATGTAGIFVPYPQPSCS